MRTSLVSIFVCAKHPESHLEIDVEKSTTTANYEGIKDTIALKPCWDCENEKRGIISAIEIITKAKEEEKCNPSES